MTGTVRGAFALIACALVVLSPRPAGASGGHALTRAALTFRPQVPRMGTPWHLAVEIESSDPTLHPARRVKVTGEMTGHPMRPVEIELRRENDSAPYAGALSFTMRGPWHITLRVEDLNDVLLTIFEVDVVGTDAEPTGFEEMRAMLDLHPPVRDNLLPPGWTLAGVVALTLVFEWGAVLLKRRSTSAPAPPRRPAASVAALSGSSPASAADR